VQVPKRAHERLLRRIFGVAGPTKDMRREPDDALPIAVQQPVDRGLVAGLRSGNLARLLAVFGRVRGS
jgi:hypothetical protein